MNIYEILVLIIAFVFLFLSAIKNNELLIIPFLLLWFGWLYYRWLGFYDALYIIFTFLSLMVLLVGIRLLIYHKHNIYIGLLLTVIGLISSYYTLSVIL